ncbi:beta-carotene 15,15'-dioxygenase, Brp/Blh family [Sphingomonas sp. HT-1]|uniref:beta-carotene 15,15'-dioxygenase, Brp/Blh family n=1 Tax=unclassified Sphingomonas TaxID=196159 RepID=UPI000AB123AF|nr:MULTISPECIES: beta-carotene 15,15'-dioxygenase, Brp/Blh family [unclassified Sphingomonas]
MPGLFWGAAMLICLLRPLGLDWHAPWATQAGMLLMLAGGLPHGGHDLMVARTLWRMQGPTLALFLACYVAAAATMALAWWAMPLAAMLGFLALAAWHFSEDWDLPQDSLLRTAAGLAPIAAAVLGQPERVSQLFVAMTDPATGRLAVALVTLVSPVALLVAAVAITLAWQGGSRRWAAAQAAALALLALAPPTLAFPTYFALLHSRRHVVAILDEFGAGGRSFSHPRLAAVLLALLACTGWALFSPRFIDLARGIDPALAFQLLSVVAVPHLIFDAMGTLFRRPVAAAPRPA